MAEVELINVSKRFGSTAVVHDVDLRIHDNEFIVLVGPSGCGKSTILRMIAGLESLSAGEIRIGKRAVNRVPPKERNLAMVFQNYALYPHMTVYENMGFSLKMQKWPKAELDKKVREVAEVLELAPFLNRSRPLSPAVSVRGLPWAGRLYVIRMFFSLMSPFPIWMPSCGLRCAWN